MFLLDVVIRDEPLCSLMRELTESPSNWELLDLPNSAPIPRQKCTIANVENARNVSPRWREVIDDSAQWASVRLARWDYNREEGVHWEPYEEYITTRFLQNWGVMGPSWLMSAPIGFVHLQSYPISRLTDGDLVALRNLLWDSNNRQIHVPRGGFLLASPDTWVSPVHRIVEN
ncbi:hypothetical protein KC19_VG144700 [Ceratodon purpureus]|uniref:F-box domain-containing protein n=1 Tax=Ceratodon purpureus TaxID=3225 RepID=A0A8T0HQ71_CERPU|nr:hypothetical protein KC19_VG144700 [Ceratodon purpureus]